MCAVAVGRFRNEKSVGPEWRDCLALNKNRGKVSLYPSRPFRERAPLPLSAGAETREN